MGEREREREHLSLVTGPRAGLLAFFSFLLCFHRNEIKRARGPSARIPVLGDKVLASAVRDGKANVLLGIIFLSQRGYRGSAAALISPHTLLDLFYMSARARASVILPLNPVPDPRRALASLSCYVLVQLNGTSLI